MLTSTSESPRAIAADAMANRQSVRWGDDRVSEPADNRDAALALQAAGFGARAGAMIIDLVVLQMAAMMINGVFLASLLDNISATSLVLATIGPLIFNGAFSLFYCVWLECSAWQATLGKRMMGIKVVDVYGRRIDFAKSSWRTLAKTMSFVTLGIGFLMPLWDHRKQAMHDKASGCLVVRSVPGQAMGDLASVR